MKKQVIRGENSLNLIPVQYQYAWDFYKNSIKNMWTPQEIGVGEDIESYRNLSPAEKHVFLNVFAQLSTMDIAAGDVVNRLNIQMTSPEHQMALAAQGFQEAIHSESYAYSAQHVGMDEEWLWNRWKEVPQIKAKIDYTVETLSQNTNDPLSYISQYFFLAVVFESAWFMSGFNPIFALASAGKVKRVSEVLEYIARDEQGHVSLGIATIRDIIAEQFDHDDHDIIAKTFSVYANKAYLLEKDYIEYIFSEGNYLGYSVEEHLAHVTFRFNLGFKQLGLTNAYLEMHNRSAEPTWINELLMHKKEKNFFETTVTEYQKVKLEFNADENPDDVNTVWDNPLIFNKK